MCGVVCTVVRDFVQGVRQFGLAWFRLEVGECQEVQVAGVGLCLRGGPGGGSGMFRSRFI